jgi:serine/threonine protein kinase
VCDFGFTILVKDKAKAQQAKGSPYYMAPELLLGQGASRRSDVYAYGIILHFLVTLERVPFEGAEHMEVRRHCLALFRFFPSLSLSLRSAKCLRW